MTLHLGIGFKLGVMPGLTIGKLAQRAGIAVQTIRFYERRGLIPDPPRKASGYRQYPAGTLRRLRFIRRAKELGFSLREIEELLALRLEPTTPCAAVQRQIGGKLQDVQERIRDLQRMGRALEELHTLCETNDPLGDCPILDLLEQTGNE